jgi:hypothetical protein
MAQGPESSDVNLSGEARASLRASASARVERAQSRAVGELLARASWIGKGDGDQPTASFTSLFLAFLASDDELSTWIQDKVTWIGPTLSDVVVQWNHRLRLPVGLNEERVRRARNVALGDSIIDPVNRTASVEKILLAAHDLATRVQSEGELDLRHVFAVYLYAPPGHGDDLRGWRFDREAWATRFICYVCGVHASEASGWRALHERVFPRAQSTGIREAQEWAWSLPTASRAGSRMLDSEMLLGGIALDGLAYSDSKYMSVGLVAYLGGKSAIETMVRHPLPESRAGAESMPLSDEVESILDRARVFATASREARQIHLRHLLAAMMTDRRPLGALASLRRIQRQPEGLLAWLRRWIAQLPPEVEDIAAWDRLLDEFRESVVADYDNDEARGEDQLNIKTDVRALAAVLASTKVTPPLSVGLFGDWGSGKSFFMAKVRERIDQLAAAAKARRSGESWFCGRKGDVVQIDFNAWHYMDADLWSSLSVRVFDALSDVFKGDLAAECLNEIESLQERKVELTREQKALGDRAESLAKQLGETLRSKQGRQVTLEEQLRGLAHKLVTDIAADPQVRAVRETLELQAEDVRKELELVRIDVKTFTGQIARWWGSREGRWVRIAVLLLGVGTPILAMYIGSHVAGWSIAGPSAGLLALGFSLRRVIGRASSMVDGALQEIARMEAEARSKKSELERQSETEIEATRARLAEIEREQSQVEKRRLEIEAKLAALTGEKNFKDFILERAASDDYRKKLGVIAAVHRDFQQLAAFLSPDRKNNVNVERIVLYIDDLDRCPPARVVEVLQAVHIILSLPLFVVVVGVDSGWLHDSLVTYYGRQFRRSASSTGAARPQQYLEKIFQIPFTLRPMSRTGFGSLMSSVLERHVPKDDEAPDLETPQPRGERSAPAGATSARGGSRPEIRPPSPGVEARVDLTPRGLRLEPSELDNIRDLSGMIASPRAAKRLANLYRIVRATLDDNALDALIAGRFRLMQLCLAIVIGQPMLSAELFSAILAKEIRSRTALDQWCTRRLQHQIRFRDANVLIGLKERSTLFEDWESVREVVLSAARFSFETGRVLSQYVEESVASTV